MNRIHEKKKKKLLSGVGLGASFVAGLPSKQWMRIIWSRRAGTSLHACKTFFKIVETCVNTLPTVLSEKARSCPPSPYERDNMVFEIMELGKDWLWWLVSR